MLKSSQRLRREAFKPLLESKKYAHSPYFLLKTAPADSTALNKAKFAVSVSKKVSKKAVVRNRVRRRAYAALSVLSKDAGPRLCLFIAKPGAEKLGSAELFKELEALLKKS